MFYNINTEIYDECVITLKDDVRTSLYSGLCFGHCGICAG